MVSADDVRARACGYGCPMRLWRSSLARIRAMDPLRADLLLAGAFLVLAGVEIATLISDRGDVVAVAALDLLMAAGLVARRRLPVTAMALVLCGFVGLQWLGKPTTDEIYAPFFVMLFSVYSAGVRADGRHLPFAAALAFALTSLGTVVDDYPNTVTDYLLGGTIIAFGPLLLGRVIRNRGQLNRTLRERAASLRREQAEQAERAAAEERTRIAGELHDVVAHAMSAMVVQAAGARRLAATDPARAREAFATVETTGRDALAEIRRLLGVLRREDEEIALAPQPSLRHLDALVRRTAAGGLPVALTVEGEARDLPAGVDLTAYRLVQEALGGAQQSGAAGRAEVTIRYQPDGVEVQVVDDAMAFDGDRQLVGVRERVSLYGGQMEAGRRRGGGHAVRARLPVGGSA
jgi:signal transduction histidine kinase